MTRRTKKRTRTRARAPKIHQDVAAIKVRMRAARVSLRALADLSGMHAGSLCLILAGKRDPRLGTIGRIEKALDSLDQARR